MNNNTASADVIRKQLCTAINADLDANTVAGITRLVALITSRIDPDLLPADELSIVARLCERLSEWKFVAEVNHPIMFIRPPIDPEKPWPIIHLNASHIAELSSSDLGDVLRRTDVPATLWPDIRQAAWAYQKAVKASQ